MIEIKLINSIVNLKIDIYINKTQIQILNENKYAVDECILGQRTPGTY